MQKIILENKNLKGVNIGSWLLMEGYILGGRNIAESIFKKQFEKNYGKRELKNFECLFRDNFITEKDFQAISRMGAKAIRIPFHHKLIEKYPYVYSEEAFSYFDKIFSWARRYGLGIILDLHAAPGAQNHDWHADSQGEALLWENKEFQKRTFSLWEAIAERFKNETSLIGYDILNEPVVTERDLNVLKKFYQETKRYIRNIDKKHLIFLEGNMWAQNIDFLKDLIGENIWVSIHAYQPLNYTFNFSRFTGFPGKIDGSLWDKSSIRKYLEPYFVFSTKNKVNIFVGEFGINWRGGYFGELEWLKSILKTCEDFGFGYTYWTYKAVSGSVFPDGLYQYFQNNKYINRLGPIFGWETYLKFWGREKKEIVDFWKTANFVPNKNIIAVLENSFRNN